MLLRHVDTDRLPFFFCQIYYSSWVKVKVGDFFSQSEIQILRLFWISSVNKTLNFTGSYIERLVWYQNISNKKIMSIKTLKKSNVSEHQ